MRQKADTSRCRNLVSFLAAATLAAMALGCSDDIDKSARFASANEAEIGTAIETGAGAPMAYAMFSVFQAEMDHAISEGVCPQRVATGDTVVFSADGCVAPSGTEYSGTLTARNSPFVGGLLGLFGETTAIPDQPMSLELESFRISNEQGAQEINGSAWQSLAMPEDGQAFTASLDLDVETDGLGSRVSMEVACDESGLCTIEAGSFGEVDGVGGLAIAGVTYTVDDAQAGWLELTGVDALRVDYSAEEEGCVPYTIDGAPAGTFCFDYDEGIEGSEVGEGGQGSEEELEASGYSLGCGDGTFDLTAWVVGEAETVTFTVSFGDRLEMHVLELTGFDEDWQEYIWEAVLVEGDEYISGQSTLFRCDDIDIFAGDHSVTAEDRDGNVSSYP